MRFNPSATLFLAAVCTLAAAQNAQHGQPKTSNSVAPSAFVPGVVPFAKKTQETEGEQIFKQQCSRCHGAPDGFSPRISGTVVRHMRVRAQLSMHDEAVLLRFFNP